MKHDLIRHHAHYRGMCNWNGCVRFHCPVHMQNKNRGNVKLPQSPQYFRERYDTIVAKLIFTVKKLNVSLVQMFFFKCLQFQVFLPQPFPSRPFIPLVSRNSILQYVIAESTADKQSELQRPYDLFDESECNVDVKLC